MKDIKKENCERCNKNKKLTRLEPSPGVIFFVCSKCEDEYEFNLQEQLGDEFGITDYDISQWLGG